MRDHAPLSEPERDTGDPDGPDDAAPVWWADRPDDGPPAHHTTARRRRRRWLLLAAFVETLLIIIGLTWLITGRHSTADDAGRPAIRCTPLTTRDDGHCDRAARDAAVRAGLTDGERAAARGRTRDIVAVVRGLHRCPPTSGPCAGSPAPARSGTASGRGDASPGAVSTASGMAVPPGPGGMPPGPGGMPPGPGGMPPGPGGMPPGGGPPGPGAAPGGPAAPGVPPPPDAPTPEQVAAALVAAGFADSTARAARPADPAPVGSLLFAVGVGPACVLGFDMPGAGSQWVVGRLPDGHCLTI